MLVGSDGPSTSHVQKLIKKKNYKEFVSYLGRVPFNDLLRLFNTADVSCLWSWIEAEGLVLLESMAQGTPCIGSNSIGISDVIRHGETGYLSTDLEDFKSRVIQLFKDDDLRSEMGRNAKRVAQNYRMSNVAKTWVELYKFMINELYPLRYYNKERKERVNLVKEFIHKLPIVNF